MQLENSAIAEIMIPDALTPGQYYDGMRSDDVCARPIKRLMLAVLEDAMRCYQTYATSRSLAQRRLFVEAELWLMDRAADGPFTFETVCETVGIDPNCLREGLRRWRVQHLDGLNPRRLARRSPVTRAGRISAPLRRRRRKPSAAAGSIADDFAIAVRGNGNAGSAALLDGEGGSKIVGYNGEVEGVNELNPGAAIFSASIGIQEAASA